MQRLHLIIPLALVGCVSPPPPAAPPGSSAAPRYPSWEEVPAAQPEPAPAAASFGWHLDAPAEGRPLAGGGATLETLTVSRGGHSVDLQLVVFDSRHYDLQVLDQPEDWSGGGKITACMQQAGAAAGVNGGFFTPEFDPMGLMIAGGRTTGSWQSNKLLSGAVVVTAQPRLLWNSEVATRDARHLLQAGPRLVDAGRPVAGLDRKKHATRTFIANDGSQRWFFGLAAGVSLGELAEILATPGLTAFPVHRALNLDGGRSSALYYRSTEGREHSAPGWSTVRNYLAIIPR
jgi:hypothetical protein